VPLFWYRVGNPASRPAQIKERIHMQQEDLKNMQTDLINYLAGKLQQSPKEEILNLILRVSVEDAFRKMSDEQKIMSLSSDEVELLIDFRNWSNSIASVSGVFHWQKKYGK
jgi:DNA-directed RNA polymerase specialized sigma subunit